MGKQLCNCLVLGGRKGGGAAQRGWASSGGARCQVAVSGGEQQGGVCQLQPRRRCFERPPEEISLQTLLTTSGRKFLFLNTKWPFYPP